MHKKNELKNEIEKLIKDSDFDNDTKEIWKRIFSNLADFQEEMLENIAVSSSISKEYQWNILCGITSLNKNKIGKNYFHMSISDDITSDVFPNGEETKIKKDNDWFIIGTGYLNCQYEDIKKYCGRDKSYKGFSKQGEFEYSLVLNNSILNSEKILYQIAEYYNLNQPIIFAPMLRRLVYIETKTMFKDSLKEADLMLKENGIECLLGDWRAIWNVEISQSPYGISNMKSVRYFLEKNEFITPIDEYESRIHITKEFDNNKQQEYYLASSDSIDEIKKFVIKSTIHKTNNENDISDSDMIIYKTFGKLNSDITHIYSKSDIVSALKGFSDTIKLEDVYTSYPNGLYVCAYDSGYEYPLYPKQLIYSSRPTLYLSFEKIDDMYFYDRIVFVIHTLQRQYPEFIWKGGYFNE